MIPDRGSAGEFETAALAALPFRHGDFGPDGGRVGENLRELGQFVATSWPSGAARWGGANRLAPSRRRVTKQTWRRTAAISSIAAKLESATMTMTMSRLGSQRLIWRMPCRAQPTNVL
jgi:hypothetical protein